MAVDNTVATPVLTRPFDYGADLVVHSASKYLNGHGDVLAGAVLASRRDPSWERVRSWRRNAGAMPGPFEAWLLQRGMRTLFLRVRQASQDPCWSWPPISPGTPRSALCSIPGCPVIRVTRSRPGRCAADLAGCCPSGPAGGAGQAQGGAARGAGVQAGHLTGWGGEPDRAPPQQWRGRPRRCLMICSASLSVLRIPWT